MKKLFKAVLDEIVSWVFFAVRWIPGKIGIVIRYLLYKGCLKGCGKGVSISMGCYIMDCRNITIGEKVNIGLNSQIYASGKSGERIDIGNNVGCNSGVMINADCGGRISIGSNVLIGPNCVLRASNHAFSDISVPMRSQGHKPGKIALEEDVWLGANVVVLPDVVIGKGSVVAAGAVVTKDVEAFSIAGGVPAKVISKRGKT